ncbi:MAG: RimK-like ATPgrasp N-terminal domain-containing protein [Ignavibacteria bacterium]
MKLALVADHACQVRIPGAAVVAASSYLTDPAWRDAAGWSVINLCRSWAYQRSGYYVSLLAEARGHRPLPRIDALHEIGSPSPSRVAVAAAQRCAGASRRQNAGGLRLAILRDPDSHCPASNDAAILRFEQAARALGLQTERVSSGDIDRLAHCDGLFIRDNTFVRHHTFRFARRAAAQGMVVIDAPDSILRCNNKVFLAELLPRHGIPTPRTFIVHRANIEAVVPALGLPCVLKRPDSSLSLGVVKVDNVADLRSTAMRMLAESELVVAQEFSPTAFDWRIGILDGTPLFACRYHMVPGHWQILRHVAGRHYDEGRTEALPLADAPPAAVDLALRATRLIGGGFYGVDLKEVAPNDFRVIEVNDNPNVDAGNEDGVLQDALYLQVMSVFARRMSDRRRRRP